MQSSDKVFYTTGRLTSEMVIKSAQMGVPIIVSRSGITQMGHDIAERLGLCTIGRATSPIQVLAANQWLRTPGLISLEILAAFVMPNSPAVTAVVSEVADRLCLSTKTIANHQSSIRQKLGVANAAQFLRAVARDGLGPALGGRRVSR